MPAMVQPEAPSEAMSDGMNDMGKAAGGWLKDNYFADPSASGTDQAVAAAQYGPEVAKMGGMFAPADTSKSRGFGGMWDDSTNGLGMLGKASTYSPIMKLFGG